jgi:hypothetical protein
MENSFDCLRVKPESMVIHCKYLMAEIFSGKRAFSGMYPNFFLASSLLLRIPFTKIVPFQLA